MSIVITVPSELFAPAESSSFSGTWDPHALTAGPDLYDFAQPLSWKVEVSNTGDALLLRGTVEGVGRTSCARCLDAVDVSIAGEVEGYFLLHEDDVPEDDMEEDEFSVLSPDKTIDLEPLLQAAVVMDVPQVPLCRDDCRGLCPTCGANLNRESCDCAQARDAENREFEQAKNPFAVLRELDLNALASGGEDAGKNG